MPQDFLLKLVQQRIDHFCDEKRAQLVEISEDLVPIIDYTQQLLSGGKRFRALFAFWSWVGHLDREISEADLKLDSPIVGIAAALEMFHAAALVHDDLLDQSDTRRGQPAIHKRFEELHRGKGFAGSSERFGLAGSVLTGDLMLAWSSELFGAAFTEVELENEISCREQFSQMRFEVMAGQYLDVLEENAAPTRQRNQAVAIANKVMLYKTAKYSLEAPLLIGASLAGASAQSLRALSDFGIPLGLAFQLRDDVLGVFGDPEVTGKPAGDDLREGKRTVLVGLALEALPQTVANLFDELLGNSDLEADQIDFLRDSITESGALTKTERLIQEHSQRAIEALAALEVTDTGRKMLSLLAEKVIRRSS